MEEDEDEVVKEIPVYLSKTLKDQLYLLQYPIRPSTMTYENFSILEAQIKPKQQKLHMDIQLNANNRHYNKSRAEQLAINADGVQGESTNTMFPSGRMDRQTLESDRTPVNNACYAVGLITNNEMHLSPLSAVINLRPAFNYMDQSDKNNKVYSTPTAEKEEDIVEEPEAVNVKFARPETERMKLARERSFWYQQAKSADESWVPLTINSKLSAETSRDYLTSGVVDEDETKIKCAADTYLKSLVPPPETQIDIDSNVCNSSVMSLTQLKSLPLSDQVQAILVNARVVKFDQLVTLLTYCGASVDRRELILAVQQHAYLVRGNWVVKSDTLYAVKGTTSVAANLLARGRDYILYIFTQKEYVDRRTLTAATKLPPDEVEEILKEVARFTAKKGWSFKGDRDVEFEKKYSDTVHRQEMLWESRQQQLSKEFKEQGKQSPAKPRARRRTKSGRESFSSDGESGSESGIRQRRGSGRGELPRKLMSS